MVANTELEWKLGRYSRAFKRGASPSFFFFPLPLDKGKGDKGGWGR